MKGKTTNKKESPPSLSPSSISDYNDSNNNIINNNNPPLQPSSSKENYSTQYRPYISFLKIGTCLILSLTILISILLIGEQRERKHWYNAQSTLSLYSIDSFCVYDEAQPNKNKEISSTDLPNLKHDDTIKILNCGHCGECSNTHDISIYHHMKNTLTEVMTTCAKIGVFTFNWNNAYNCLKTKANMSDNCTNCWIQNAICNSQNCLSTCVKHRFFPSWMPSLPETFTSDGIKASRERLDPCFDCDERLCGPAFVQCAGANRRRTGIVSDIARDDEKELCRGVDIDWILEKVNSIDGEEQGSSKNIKNGEL